MHFFIHQQVHVTEAGEHVAMAGRQLQRPLRVLVLAKRARYWHEAVADPARTRARAARGERRRGEAPAHAVGERQARIVAPVVGAAMAIAGPSFAQVLDAGAARLGDRRERTRPRRRWDPDDQYGSRAGIAFIGR